VLILGAGIVGAACAAEFAAQGLRVTVLERGAVGGGATAAGMGHLLALDDSPAQLALTRYALGCWDALLARSAEDYERCGTVWVAADAADLAALRRRPLPGEPLDERSLYACEPGLRPGLAGGLLAPDDGVLYAPAWAARLLRQAGARLVRGEAVALRPRGVLLADGGTLSAGAVVLAAGADAAALAPELPLQPRKGHLAITDRHPGLVRHQLVEVGYAASARRAGGESVAFNLQPRSTGQLLIGSSRQPGVAGAAVEHGVLGRMLARAVAYLPALAGLDCIRAWTGVRAATPDGLPLIGPHPGRPGLWLAAGHEGLGITLAPATAQLLAAQLLGRAPELSPAPYLPARFPELARLA